MIRPLTERGLLLYDRARELERRCAWPRFRIGLHPRGATAVRALPIVLTAISLLGAWAAIVATRATGHMAPPRQDLAGARLAAQEGLVPTRLFLPLLGPDAMTGRAPVAQSMPAPPERSVFWRLALAPDRNLLLAADRENGLRIFDVSRTANLRELSRIQPFASAQEGHGGVRTSDVEIEWPYAYVALSGRGTAVVDISDPRAPIQVAEPGPPLPGLQAVAVASWNRLIVRSGSALDIFDIARRSDPTWLQRFFGWRLGSNECPQASGLDQLYEHRETVYYVRGCGIEVMTFDADLETIETRQVGLSWAWESALARDLDRLYVVGEFGGLEVFDVSIPAQPTRVGAVSEAAFPFMQLDTNDDGFGVAWTGPRPSIGHDRFQTVDLRNAPSVVLGPTVHVGQGDRIKGNVLLHGDVAFVIVDSAQDVDQQELRVYDGIRDGNVRLVSRIR